MFYLCFSCGAGWSDMKLNLGNQYYYFGGGGYNYLHKSLPNDYMVESLYLAPSIKIYNYNDEYIIAKQTPHRKNIVSNFSYEVLYPIHHHIIHRDERKFSKRDSVLLDYMEKMKWEGIGSVDDNMKMEEIASKIIDTIPKYQEILSSSVNYYIIEKKLDKIHGPLDKLAYQKKRNELDVPEALELEE